jgi:septation ring formation regulator EzrA
MKKGVNVDDETRAAFQLRDERHEEVIRRIVKVESVQENLREGIDQIKDEHDDFRVKYTNEVTALRGDLKVVLPQALAAIPQEFEEQRLREQQRVEEERRLELQRTHVRWIIISAVIAALSGLATWIAVAAGMIHG